MVTKYDKRVKEEIGHFVDHFLSLRVFGSEDHFSGLLDHLFQDAVDPALE
jgi:hypothetical protein